MAKGRISMDPAEIYAFLTTVPRGKVVTYGQIGRHFGNPRLARAVGNILHENPDGDRYPCYKVVNSQGRLSQRYAFGGLQGQAQRLRREGIPVENGRVDLKQYQYDPDK